jgi:hypothetical protein
MDLSFTPRFENKVLDKRPSITRGTRIRVVKNPVSIELQTDLKRVSHTQQGGGMASLQNGHTIDSLVVIPRRLSWRL